jgi:arsenate reductase
MNDTIAIDLMSKHPELIQRPVVIYKDNAIIGRPPEKVLELFDKD